MWTKPVYLVVEVFILKLLSINALTPGAIMVGEVASLDHELLDNCEKQRRITFTDKLDGIEVWLLATWLRKNQRVIHPFGPFN